MPENDTKNENKNNNNGNTTILNEEWMVRPCDVYADEYSDCTSIKARFHQYFVFGKTVDCSQWKRDHSNCIKWTQNNDLTALKELIESEKVRRSIRLRNHYANNVWEKRTSPPEDWAKPLPESMLQEYEYTYLHIKAKEMKGEIEPTKKSTSFCFIS